MTQTTFFNFTLFGGATDHNQPAAWFTVDDNTGRLTARGHGTPETTDHQVDLHEHYVMPGFFNVHTHVTLDPQSISGDSGQSEAEAGVFAFENLQTLLKSGVTYVRELGTNYDVDVKLKRLQQRGLLPHTPIC